MDFPYRLPMMKRLILAGLISCTAAQASAEVKSTNPVFLLHTPIAPALFQKLRIWDAKEDEWRATTASEKPVTNAAVVVVHLWADYCAPCREEFPLLRDLAKQVEAKYKDRVSFLYLCETSSSTEVARFFTTNRTRMPTGPYYQDTGESIANVLRANIAGGQLSLPVTVLLDEKRIVRQAIIGPITPHRGELAAGIAKLVQLADGSLAHGSTPR